MLINLWAPRNVSLPLKEVHSGAIFQQGMFYSPQCRVQYVHTRFFSSSFIYLKRNFFFLWKKKEEETWKSPHYRRRRNEGWKLYYCLFKSAVHLRCCCCWDSCWTRRRACSFIERLTQTFFRCRDFSGKENSRHHIWLALSAPLLLETRVEQGRHKRYFPRKKNWQCCVTVYITRGFLRPVLSLEKDQGMSKSLPWC